MSDSKKTIEELKAMLEAATPPFVAPTDEEMTKGPVESVTMRPEDIEAGIRALQKRRDDIALQDIRDIVRLRPQTPMEVAYAQSQEKVHWLTDELTKCLDYLEWLTIGHTYSAGTLQCRGCILRDELRDVLPESTHTAHFQRTIDSQMEVNGRWFPAIPEPWYGLRKRCVCGRKFWRLASYQRHWQEAHSGLGYVYWEPDGSDATPAEGMIRND